jgi:hypothetical protein
MGASVAAGAAVAGASATGAWVAAGAPPQAERTSMSAMANMARRAKFLRILLLLIKNLTFSTTQLAGWNYSTGFLSSCLTTWILPEFALYR